MKESVEKKTKKINLFKLGFALLVTGALLTALVVTYINNYNLNYEYFDCKVVIGHDVREVCKELANKPCAIILYPRDYLFECLVLIEP